MTEPLVFDVTAADFESAVVQRSQTVPILLDFWADWCDPCKTLAPVLESVVTDYGGSFLVGKIDSEVERDLAYAFQVQGIPFCVLFSAGRPLDAFSGAIGEAELKEFLQRSGVEPAAPSAEDDQPAEDLDSPEARLRDGLAAAARGDADLQGSGWRELAKKNRWSLEPGI